ncbi:MAG: SH3 domain-containing protein, partial [Sedimentisphaerales bacterium]|nr:SH3 domain-containing protein [Sedimentisphaerales bacterium]
MQARMKSAGRATQIAFRGQLLLIVVLIAVLGLCGSVGAQPDVNVPAADRPQAAQPTPAQPTPALAGPLVGEITGNDVFIRSGPATTSYQCGKLYKGDTVQVVDTQQGWSCIVPPPGCFS